MSLLSNNTRSVLADTPNNSTAPKGCYAILGAGSFGTALANLMAENAQTVYLFTRKEAVYKAMCQTRSNRGQALHEHIQPTIDIADVCARCTLLFPMATSKDFRELMQLAAPHLKPHHLLIHGTKGLNIILPPETPEFVPGMPLKKQHIRTMSQIMLEETTVLRVGCLSGPNLAAGLVLREPAATAIASRFTEVITYGREALHTPLFRVYGSHDVFGVELAGALSKTIAIAAGIVCGMGWGENSVAMLLTRAVSEVIRLGKALGADASAFLGLAGIGDIIATSIGNKSRNFSVGYRLAKGEARSIIEASMQEVAEGIYTVAIAKGLADAHKVKMPIINALFEVLYSNQPIEKSIAQLLQNDFDLDVNF